MLEQTAVYLASILALGMIAQWLAWRLRVPAIVLLLACGFLCRYLAGPPNEIISEDLHFPLVSLAVGVIMFEGGLSLRFRDMRGNPGVVFRLVTIGLVVTWARAAPSSRKRSFPATSRSPASWSTTDRTRSCCS